jgi:periplasmic protein TonB
MKTMKTKQAGVERYRPVFTQIGFIIALGISLMAFEWKTYEKAATILLGANPIFVPEEFAPITTQPKPPPPPISIARFTLNDNPEIDLPELNIEASVDVNIPDKPWFPPPLPDELPEPDDIPRLHAEVMPSFPGGEVAMHNFLKERLRFPAQAIAARISGTVYLSFVVERDGSITEIEVLRGGEGGLGQEAVRVVKLMPSWNPGIQAGRPVKVKFTMPIKFVLQY